MVVEALMVTFFPWQPYFFGQKFHR
jgi:hypothetical protein